MENKNRFRNHASVILEKSLKPIGTLIAVLFLNLLSDITEGEMEQSESWIIIAVLVGLVVVVLGYQTILWAKTYIFIEENTLVVERNTLNKKRNTIGLKVISNVNLEQNILEMILGTCKVKLDTNSLSTADETDVHIVLKKADAEKFRALVLAKEETTEVVSEQQETDTSITGMVGDVILHGLFSTRITLVILLIGIVGLQIWTIMTIGTEELGETIVEIGISLAATFYTAAGIMWNIVKEFIKYINFRIERKEDKVFLSYGLFKKVAYSVPVDKINGIRLTQTPIARMAKYYMVEIINVGMDDNENEASTFFLPYSKLETIQSRLHALLPEFDGALEIKEEKQPAAIWLLSIPWLILYLLFTAVGYMTVATYEPDAKMIVIYVAAGLLVLRAIAKLAGFLTKGICVDKKFLKIVNGGFGKKMLFVKYDKIQYVVGNQCIMAKQFKMQKGTIFLLASLKNRVHALPYFKEIDMEQLKKELV